MMISDVRTLYIYYIYNSSHRFNLLLVANAVKRWEFDEEFTGSASWTFSNSWGEKILWISIKTWNYMFARSDGEYKTLPI